MRKFLFRKRKKLAPNDLLVITTNTALQSVTDSQFDSDRIWLSLCDRLTACTPFMTERLQRLVEASTACIASANGIRHVRRHLSLTLSCIASGHGPCVMPVNRRPSLPPPPIILLIQLISSQTACSHSVDYLPAGAGFPITRHFGRSNSRRENRRPLICATV